MIPTVRLAAVLAAIGVAGLVLPLSVVSALWILVLVGAFIDARLVKDAPTATREVPPLARGVASPFHITVHPNEATRRAGRITVRQPRPPDISIEPSQSDGLTLEANITARRRGVHALPDIAVRLVGPLGLGAVVHQIHTRQSVTVHPDLPTAHRLAMATRRGLLQADGRNGGPLGLGTEFEAVREYRPDDDVRQINWLATARTGRAMSTVYRLEEERDLVLCVDTARLTAGSFAGPPSEQPTDIALAATTRLDTLFDAIAALALVADEVGDRIGFLAYDSEELVRLTPQRRNGQGVINAALKLEPRPMDADHGLAVLRLPALRRSVVMLCTELLDVANSGDLLVAVARLHASHDVIVVTSLDPAVEAARVSDDPSVKLAAVDISADREELVRRLIGCGATVVSSPPHTLAATAARAYLSARSGRRPKRHTNAQ